MSKQTEQTKGQPAPDKPARVKRAFLVYQSGIANVFGVDCFNLNSFGRNARRLLQSDFKTCAAFARGLGAAGVIVRTASCNVAGDCSDVQWLFGTAGTPFRDQAADISLN